MKAVILLLSIFSFASFASGTFKIKHATAGALEKHIEIKDRELKIHILAQDLSDDPAIESFSKFLSDICLNPKKYGFEETGSDKSICAQDHVHKMTVVELAEALVHDYKGKNEAAAIESYLNEFMNNYLKKVRAVIEAFNDFM